MPHYKPGATWQAKRTPKPAHCQCADPGCPIHPGHHTCDQRAKERLFRVDMEDREGTWFCTGCANDALSSGLFCD